MFYYIKTVLLLVFGSVFAEQNLVFVAAITYFMYVDPAGIEEMKIIFGLILFLFNNIIIFLTIPI